MRVRTRRVAAVSQFNRISSTSLLSIFICGSRPDPPFSQQTPRSHALCVLNVVPVLAPALSPPGLVPSLDGRRFRGGRLFRRQRRRRRAHGRGRMSSRLLAVSSFSLLPTLTILILSHLLVTSSSTRALFHLTQLASSLVSLFSLFSLKHSALVRTSIHPLPRISFGSQLFVSPLCLSLAYPLEDCTPEPIMDFLPFLSGVSRPLAVASR